MYRFRSVVVGVLVLVFLAGCQELHYFTLKFSNIGTIDVNGLYVVPSGEAFVENLLPVEALHGGEYVVLENVPRFTDYDIRVVFQALLLPAVVL